MDCTGEELCEVCELQDPSMWDFDKAVIREPRKPSKVIGWLGSVGYRMVIDEPARLLEEERKQSISTDHQILSILRQLHNTLAGSDHECRWHHNEQDQNYSCEHITIPARDVVDRYWQQFNG